MPLSVTKADLVQLVAAKTTGAQGELACSGAHFDSRLVERNQLFVALKGEKQHGHAFLDDAFARGATLALVEDAGLLRSSVHRDRLLAVVDTSAAFSRLGAHWRSATNVRLAAVTGSIGKTATKEMCAAILSLIGRGTSSKKSYNNHIGVPFTLCQLSRDDRWAVLEVGMNHAGELSGLSKLIRPNVAAVTCIAPVHTQFFPSLAAIADAKCEIVEGVTEKDFVVVNGDDGELMAALSRSKKLKKKHPQLLQFGEGQRYECSVRNVRTNGLSGITFDISLLGDLFPVEMRVLGRHNALNAAAAALIAKTIASELSVAAIQEALHSFEPPAMRLNLVEISGGRRIIDDSYNASPVAVKAALGLLAELRKPGQVIGAILGDMFELGDRSDRYHREVGKEAARLKFDFVLAVGEKAALIAEEARRGGVAVQHFSSPELAAEELLQRKFDIALVKGSRGMKLERAIAVLKGG